MADFLSWYHEIPFASRCYLTAAFAVTAACYLDIVSPLTLYYNYDLVLNKGQYWRLISSFLFFGTFSLDFIFHMYFVSRYCRLLEEGSFRGRTADFIGLIIYGMIFMLIASTCFDSFTRIKFLGHPLTFMMVYLWSRDIENAHIQMSFLGILQFTAPYLPWVLLSFSLLIGNPIEMDVLGIIAGHIYYFFDLIYPQIAEIRGWPVKKIVFTPPFLHYLFHSERLFDFLNTRVRFLFCLFCHMSILMVVFR